MKTLILLTIILGIGIITFQGDNLPKISNFPLKQGITEGYWLVGGSAIKGIVQPATIKIESLGVIVERVIQCESSGKHEGVWGDLNKKYPAYGIGQFQERTFCWLAGLAEKDLNWKSEADQVWLLEWAIENGWGKLWSCF